MWWNPPALPLVVYLPKTAARVHQIARYWLAAATVFFGPVAFFYLEAICSGIRRKVSVQDGWPLPTTYFERSWTILVILEVAMVMLILFQTFLILIEASMLSEFPSFILIVVIDGRWVAVARLGQVVYAPVWEFVVVLFGEVVVVNRAALGVFQMVHGPVLYHVEFLARQRWRFVRKGVLGWRSIRQVIFSEVGNVADEEIAIVAH